MSDKPVPVMPTGLEVEAAWKLLAAAMEAAGNLSHVIEKCAAAEVGVTLEQLGYLFRYVESAETVTVLIGRDLNDVREAMASLAAATVPSNEEIEAARRQAVEWANDYA